MERHGYGYALWRPNGRRMLTSQPLRSPFSCFFPASWCAPWRSSGSLSITTLALILNRFTDAFQMRAAGQMTIAFAICDSRLKALSFLRNLSSALRSSVAGEPKRHRAWRPTRPRATSSRWELSSLAGVSWILTRESRNFCQRSIFCSIVTNAFVCYEHRTLTHNPCYKVGRDVRDPVMDELYNRDIVLQVLPMKII